MPWSPWGISPNKSKLKNTPEGDGCGEGYDEGCHHGGRGDRAGGHRGLDGAGAWLRRAERPGRDCWAGEDYSGLGLTGESDGCAVHHRPAPTGATEADRRQAD